jgi:hypothetical protein
MGESDGEMKVFEEVEESDLKIWFSGTFPSLCLRYQTRQSVGRSPTSEADHYDALTR